MLFFAPPASAGPDQSPVSIKIWEYPRWREHEHTVDRFYWLKQQIAEFEHLHPGISIDLTELTWEHGEDKKKIAITAGVGPDIISGVLPIQLVEAGLVEPIDEYLPPEKKVDFLSPALTSFTYNEKIYGWPWYLTGAALIANTDLLNPACVSAASSNWTYTDFSDCVRRLTIDRDANGTPDTYGFAFLIRPGDTSVWPFLFPAGIPSTGPGAEIDEFPHKADWNFLSALAQEQNATPAFCAAWDSETLWQRFTAQRDVAIIPIGIWAIPRLRTLKDFNFDVLPFPSPTRDEPPAHAFVGTSGFMVLHQSNEQKRRLCMEFAQFLVRPEAQKDLARYGVIPSSISAGDIYPDDAVMAKVQQILSTGQTVPLHPQWAEIDEKFQRELQLALTGRKPVSDAMAESAGRIKEILQSDVAVHSTRQANPLPDLVWFIGAIGASLMTLFFIMNRRRFQSASAFAFLLPALATFAVFLLFPLCWVFFLAFEDFSFAQAGTSWVGMRNILHALKDSVFQRALVNTFIYTIVVVPANILSALVVASLIHPLSNRTRSFFRGAYYLPGVISVVVLAMAWRWMFNENIGVLNTALGFLGLPGVRWLTDTRIALWSVILTSIARPPGGPVLIYLAALDAIPSSLYDAAELDGAGPIKKWWHITIPLLKPTTLFLALTITIGCFQVFAQVFVLTDGGPGYATEVVTHQIYTTAIRDFNFGVAAAMSLFLFAVIMLASFVQYRWFNSEIEY